MTNENLMANAATSIISNRAKVWNALITPSAIKQYMFGADVESDWNAGSKITWKGEFNDKQYEDKGIILKVAPEKMLQYSHFSPLSGKHDSPENYHIVTINLADGADRTEVSLTQDNNDSEQARLESEKNWSVVLEGLKKYVEQS